MKLLNTYNFLFLLVILIMFVFYNFVFDGSNTSFLSMGFKFMYIFSCLNFIKILVLNFFPKKFHSWTIQIHSAILICYFLYLGNFIGVFMLSVAYCFPNLTGKLQTHSESGDSSSVTAKGGAGNQAGSEGSLQQSIYVGKGASVDVINIGDPYGVGNGLAGGALLTAGIIAATLPTPPAKLGALAIGSVTALSLTNGGNALKQLNQTFSELGPIVKESLRSSQSDLHRQGSGSGFPSSTSINSIAEQSIIEKLKNFFTPTIVNNPLTDFSSHCAILLGIVLVLNLYVLLTITFRDPIVQKLTEKLSKYGKIGFFITKYIELATSFNRYVLIMALAWCIFILYVLINWMGFFGSIDFISK